jgi:hypothetical protein
MNTTQQTAIDIVCDGATWRIHQYLEDTGHDPPGSHDLALAIVAGIRANPAAVLALAAAETEG